MIKAISMFVSASEAKNVGKQLSLNENYNEIDYEYDKRGLEFN